MCSATTVASHKLPAWWGYLSGKYLQIDRTGLEDRGCTHCWSGPGTWVSKVPFAWGQHNKAFLNGTLSIKGAGGALEIHHHMRVMVCTSQGEGSN